MNIVPIYFLFRNIQQGTHDSLIKRKGYYYNLVQQQEKAAKEEATTNVRAHG